MRKLIVSLSISLACFVGCSGSMPSVARCTPGATTACLCDGKPVGVVTCAYDGAYDACVCPFETDPDDAPVDAGADG